MKELNWETDLEWFFLRFWEAYPKERRMEKLKTRAEFERVIKKRLATPEQLIEGAERYADYCRATDRDPHWIVYPARWLKYGRWSDDYRAELDRTHPALRGIAEARTH